MANGGIQILGQDGTLITLPPLGSGKFVAFVGLDGIWKTVDEFGTIRSSGDKNFIFTQGTPSASWAVNHALGKFPSVTVVDTGGNEVDIEVIHTDNNNLTINSDVAFTGDAYIN